MFLLETPQPQPTAPIEVFLSGTDLNGYILLAWSLAVCLLLVTAIIMVKALIAVSDAPAPSMLVVALSLLTLLAIFGGVVTLERRIVDNSGCWCRSLGGFSNSIV